MPVIFAIDLENPMTAARDNWVREDINPDELPQLRRVSDIITAFWLRKNPTPSNLKYYLVNQVQNPETTKLIGSVMRQANLNNLPSWPGLTVSIEQDAGKALLGKLFRYQRRTIKYPEYCTIMN